MANGVIETASGNLLRAGFSSFSASAGESLRADVPEPWKQRGQFGETQMHRWNGAAWELVTQPKVAVESSQRHLGRYNRPRAGLLLNEQIAAWKFTKQVGDDIARVQVHLSAGSVGVRFLGDSGADRAVITGLGFVDIDVSDLAVGENEIQTLARTAGTGVNSIEAHILKGVS